MRRHLCHVSLIGRPSSRVAIPLLLCWAFLVSSLVPFNARSVRAGARTGNSAKTKPADTFVQTPRREGELLMRFRAGTTEQQRQLVAAAQSARRTTTLRGDSGVEKLELSPGQDVQGAALQAMLDPAVEFAEPNFLITADQLGSVPDDARFNEQWSLKNTGQTLGQFGSDIDVTTAWQTTTGAPSVAIAVIDSGIDFSHPDLTNNQWRNFAETENKQDEDLDGLVDDVNGWDFVTNSGVIRDEEGHGTAVAGIIAGEGNNELGISGVMWRASLMSLRVLDKTGTGDVASAVEALDYASSHGAKVINLSWGTTGASLTLKAAIERAIRRGVVVVCSAGNSSQDVDSAPYYPASFGSRDLIAVAASDTFDQLASWSNWGAKNVTIAAPGTNILTTQMGGGYGSVSGTSAAAPLVTGVVGLLKSGKPWLNPDSVVKVITDGARKVVSLSEKVSSGGVLDAARAFESTAPYSNGGGNSGSGANPVGGTAHGPGGGFNTPVTTNPPVPNLPNLDELRNAPAFQPKENRAIQPKMICADCDPQGGGGGGGYYPGGDPNFSTARMQPINQTGQEGVDLGSRNFNWSLPLLSLPGRAGLDVNLTLYYNSLVWTKDGSFIKFNADLGSPAPGFKLGLPTLQQKFTDAQTGGTAFIMVLPSGGRVEMRQVGTTSVYESQDSTYTQLIDYDTSGALVRTTDGTQLWFTHVTINNEYRCTQIKDRNGNYISASYDATNGHIQTIIDTLGRVVSFNYDGNNNLWHIQQSWAGVTHNWATFGYDDVPVAPAFGAGLLVNGPSNNNVTVLKRVTLADNSYFTFYYNQAFGQVNRIDHYAPDANLLAYTSYNVSSAAGQTECPRFSERRDWARYWNGDTDDVAATNEEAVTAFAVDPSGAGAWTKVTMPDLSIYKEFYITSGWQKGLTNTTKNYVDVAAEQADTAKKWTTISWTQDDTNLTYQKNPRVSETNIYDAEGNRKRTTISYYPTSSFSLVSDVYEYAADATTVLRHSFKAYNLSTAYTDRRIIGLPLGDYVYEGLSTLVSKVGYSYDWSDPWLVSQGTAVQHDDSNYPASFVFGRGNLVQADRYDVQYPEDFSQSRPILRHGYNTSGSVIFSADGSWHRSDISYTDSFSDNVNRNTFAYPTTITDPEGFTSTAKYNFDFGATTRTQTPPPAGQSQGIIQTFDYDPEARLLQATTTNNLAHTRFVYPGSMGWVEHYTTVNDATEELSITHFDGAGRVRAVSADFPNSVGGYVGQLTVYNAMGQVTQQSNPIEINAAWVPQADDAAGWVWTAQSYDWKGRPTVTTNPDGWTRQNIYGGCGCAGGEVVTSVDEAGRRRRTTMDSLGRLAKVDELNWNQTLYSSSVYAYNARDQITSVTQQNDRVRSFSYDGHGRLQSQTTPEQGTTTYTYFDDDLTQTMTDARGAKSTFTYNARHLVTNIAYDVSQAAGVAATPNVSYGYDQAGNRTSMTDGLGSTSYAYDQLSRMTSETRTFTGVGAYTLSYGYNLAGELTSFTNHWNAQVTYGYDKAGRLTNVGGAGYVGVSNYASSLTYRAFGGLKGMSYGNGRSLSVSYDNRLRPTTWNVANVLGYNYNYNYFNEHTGRVTYAQNIADGTLDRSYEYDHVGRLSFSHSGAEARAHVGLGQWGTMDGPFSQGYDYDAWGNLTHRYGWGGEVQGGNAGQSSDLYYYYDTHNRRTGFSYDNAGNLTFDGGQNFTYDATGQQTNASYTGYSLQQSYDGDGLRVKKVDNGWTTYYLRSSVLGGQVVAEINWYSVAWDWTRGYVFAGSQLLAVQQSGSVNWMHEDPITKSKRVTNSAGTVVSTIELDPWGADAGRSSNALFQPKKFTSYERDSNGTDEAMFRRYNRWHSRFDQPDPSDGSYNLTNPQSFNRYSYTQNDPVNLVDPMGLLPSVPCEWNEAGGWCIGSGGSPIDTHNPISDPSSFFWDPAPIDGRPHGGGGGGGGTGGTGTGNPQNPAMDPGEAQKLLTASCTQFLNAILAELGNVRKPYSDNFSQIFKAANDQGAFHSVLLSDEELKKRLGGTNSIIGDPSLIIEVDVRNFNRSDLSGGYITIHELFHASAASGAMYSHFEMGQAAYNVATAQGLLKKLGNTSTPGPPQAETDKKSDWYNASVFDNVVRMGCPIP